MEDYKKVDEEINEQWQEMYELVMAGYGYLKIESEEELKKAVMWIKDFYENTTAEYEEALYDFEQTYITTSDDPNYEFLYDIEQIVYDGLDDLEETARESAEDLEEDYWEVIEELDIAQDDIEGILEIAQSRTDDVMDTTESDLELYINDLNEAKWDLQEEEYDVSNDIDDDINDYYEDDEDDFEIGELAATNELVNDISSSVEDFDTAPTYKEEYEQKRTTKEGIMEDFMGQEEDEEQNTFSGRIGNLITVQQNVNKDAYGEENVQERKFDEEEMEQGDLSEEMRISRLQGFLQK